MSERFFSENFRVLSDFGMKLESYAPTDEEEIKQASLLRRALAETNVELAKYDELASLTTQRLGGLVLAALQKPIDKENVIRLLVFFAQFIREATLKKSERSSGEQEVLNYFLGQPDWATNVFDGFYVDVVRHGIPFDMLEEMQRGAGVHREDILGLKNTAVSDIRAAVDSAKERIESVSETNESAMRRLKDEHFEEINQLEQRISGYKESITRLASEYNFVSLSHAFTALIARKTTEKWWSASVVGALGGVAVVFPLISLLASQTFLDTALSTEWAPAAVARLVAAVGIEVILLYFFRVALRSYLLTRTQVTNLQLRLSMCSFIEGYRDFLQGSGARDEVILERFEALIFGQLPSHDANLPATFDGLEHFATIAQSLKRA